MRSWCVLFAAVLLVGTFSFSQASAPAPTPTGHGSIPVKVIKVLDSSKLKEDESIELETAGSFKLPDGTLVPKGSKLMGRVVNTKARSKGDTDSVLNLAFDKLNLPGGKQLALKGTVQALYPPAEEQQGPNMSTMGTSQGGSAGGVGPGGAAAGMSPAVGITNEKSGSDTQSSSRPETQMSVKAEGVQGMHDLQLENGVIISKGKNVKLGTGVRIIVHADLF
jgi:hypothetical protein